MNANLEDFTKRYGAEEGRRRLEEIRDISGVGNIPLEYVGGIDIQGALDPSNTTLPEHVKDRIAELGGFSRKEADRRVEDGEVTSQESFQTKTPKFPKAG